MITREEVISLIEQGHYSNPKVALFIKEQLDDDYISYIDELFKQGLGKSKQPENWIKLINLLHSKKIFNKEDILRITKSILADTIYDANPNINFLLIFIMEKYGKDTLVDLLTQKNYKFQVQSFLSQIRAPLLEEVIQLFIKVCLHKFHATILNLLNKEYPEIFKPYVDKLNEDLKNQAAFLLKFREDTDAQATITYWVGQFANGFGAIDINGLKLICAEIKATKSNYSFNPIICYDQPGLEKFLNNFKNSKLDNARFIFKSAHTICGEIRKNQDDNYEIFLLDSLGSESGLTLALKGIISKIITIIPNRTIYVSYEKRQYLEAGCTAFAVDDVRHLYTIENYLEKKYAKDGLFAYLDDNKVITTFVEHTVVGSTHKFPIFISHIPISFIRTTQSRNLFDGMFPRRSIEEKNTLVNKAKKLPEVSAKDHYVAEEKDGKPKNLRLSYKLDKMRIAVIKMIMKHDLSVIKEKMDEFDPNQVLAVKAKPPPKPGLSR
jgi:hypothetical protein